MGTEGDGSETFPESHTGTEGLTVRGGLSGGFPKTLMGTEGYSDARRQRAGGHPHPVGTVPEGKRDSLAA